MARNPAAGNTPSAVPHAELNGTYAEAQRLLEQFLEQGDLPAVQKSIELYETLLRVSNDPFRVQRNSSSPTLVNSEGEVVVKACDLPPRRHHVLIQLTRALEERYLHTGSQCDLASAMEHGQQAYFCCKRAGLICPAVWVLYASVLDSHAHDASDSEDRRTARSLCQAAIPLCVPGHPFTATALRILSWIDLRYHEVTGAPEYIHEAIDLQRRALAQMPVSRNQDRHRHLRWLGTYLRQRYESLGDNRDLDEAISILTQAMGLCPPAHVDRPKILLAMIVWLRRKYEVSGDNEDFDRALEIGRLALEQDFARGHTRTFLLASLAGLLGFKHSTTTSPGHNLDTCIDLSREVLQGIPPRNEYRWRCTYGLAIALHTKFKRDGDVRDLEEAIELGRQVIEALPHSHPDWFGSARYLAESLAERFMQVRDIRDLDEALALSYAARAAVPPSQLLHGSVTSLRAFLLTMRFESLGIVGDLEEAIALAESLCASRETLPAFRKMQALTCLSKALLLRGRHLGDPAEIDRAINELESVKGQCRIFLVEVDVEQLRVLAACHMARFRLTRDDDDAVRSLNLLEESLRLVPAGCLDRYQCLIGVAELYIEGNTPYRNVPTALTHFLEALMDDRMDVRSRLQSAEGFLDIVRTHHEDVYAAPYPVPSQLLEIYVKVISLLPRIAFFGLDLRSRLQSLTSGQNIALCGASYALNQSLPEKALEILEQGRAIFWTHALRLRSPFDDVPENLRVRLSALARQLDRVDDCGRDEISQGRDSHALEKHAARRRRQSEEFATLLAQVRSHPGLERFMLHDEFRALAKAAERGPVVVLISSALSCHAVIIERTGGTKSIRLDGVADTWINESCAVWSATMAKARSSVVNRLKMAKCGTVAKTVAHNILRSMWVNIVRPVFDALELKPAAGRNRPRLWWCPTGNLTHLPIHAAGADGEWCSDYVVSSYTPTLGALVAARAASTPVKKRDVKALVAAVPRPATGQWDVLLSTGEEVMAVTTALQKGTVIGVSPSAEAGVPDGAITAGALLDRLPSATILHLACHGHQDPQDPLKSGFVLHDETLTIERLVPVPLPCAFLAFLSACETAKGHQASSIT
ncbi:hypothetical protein PUNSTDRAFT_134430 [Punctularia strigosozonata HHB-11173 SS5]|uniref:uncharacterized protein n=1 Tax=Punctularia strigosozonata (strain HHB-11173) TaxID=741275 RepID=UPI0004416984|nr:uncharacterized protein PUNSTDRAFT_134430 [Punctularia strigosozonata HHB-11173 SS5]EIN09272.1 hypothetical protein PUNSTDRAFT_134430 [Punctularia strigosozonata HHB-11173 SS5]